MKPLIYVLIATAMAACGTSDSSAPVPRRYAYPRVPQLDTVMAPLAATPVAMMVNKSATVGSDKSGWYNITYPTLGATMYLTVTHVSADDIEDVRANRMERLVLNAGGRPTRHTEFETPRGFAVYAVRTENSATPLQFLATDGSSAVVSAAVYFADPRAAESADSIAPAVDAIEADMFRVINSLETYK